MPHGRASELQREGSEPAQEREPSCGDEAASAAHGRRRLRRVGGPEPRGACPPGRGWARDPGRRQWGACEDTGARAFPTPRIGWGIVYRFSRAAEVRPARGRGGNLSRDPLGPGAPVADPRAKDVLLLHVGERVKYFVLKGRRGEDELRSAVCPRGQIRARVTWGHVPRSLCDGRVRALRLTSARSHAL